MIASKSYKNRLYDITRVLEAENKFASVCSYAYMDAFRPTARKIASSTSEPFTEAYINLLSEATTHIAAGRNPVDVLCDYDIILDKMMNGRKV